MLLRLRHTRIFRSLMQLLACERETKKGQRTAQLGYAEVQCGLFLPHILTQDLRLSQSFLFIASEFVLLLMRLLLFSECLNLSFVWTIFRLNY